MGSAAAHYIEVAAPAQACYDWWRSLTRLPEIFSDVKDVKAVDETGKRTQWRVSAPLGGTVEWLAEIVEDEPPHKIAWATVADSDPDVRNAGVVRFDDKGDGTTGVEVSIVYDPPAGVLGDAVAILLADPQDKVVKACEEFKRVMETR